MTDPGPGEPPPIDRRMLEFLVCPVTRGPLAYDAGRRELVGLARTAVESGAPVNPPERQRLARVTRGLGPVVDHVEDSRGQSRE